MTETGGAALRSSRSLRRATGGAGRSLWRGAFRQCDFGSLPSDLELRRLTRARDGQGFGGETEVCQEARHVADQALQRVTSARLDSCRGWSEYPLKLATSAPCGSSSASRFADAPSGSKSLGTF